MKNLICLIIAALIASSAIAQDIIIDKEGETVTCKITSVSDTEVIFKKQDGTSSSLPKSTIMMVQYADGKKQTFDTEEKLLAAVDTINNTIVNPAGEIELEKGKYYLNGKRIKEKEVIEIIKKSNCEEANNILKSRRGNKAFKLIGGACLGGGVGYGVYNSLEGEESTQTIIAGGVAVFGLSAMIISSSVMSKKLKKAVIEYNNCLK